MQPHRWKRSQGSKVGLTVNSTKSKVMVVSKEKCELTITMNNQDTLDNVEKYSFTWEVQ